MQTTHRDKRMKRNRLTHDFFPLIDLPERTEHDGSTPVGIRICYIGGTSVIDVASARKNAKANLAVTARMVHNWMGIKFDAQ